MLKSPFFENKVNLSVLRSNQVGIERMIAIFEDENDRVVGNVSFAMEHDVFRRTSRGMGDPRMDMKSDFDIGGYTTMKEIFAIVGTKSARIEVALGIHLDFFAE